MNSKKIVRGLSWVYVAFAVITVFLGVYGMRSTEAATAIANSRGATNLKGYNPRAIVAIIYGVEALFYLWYAWLLSRVAEGHSKGTLILVLGILGVVGGIFSLLGAFNIQTAVHVVISALIVFFVFKLKSEANAYDYDEDDEDEDDDEEETV
ncbi:MAG: hypothetical protein IJJ00_02445 [Erysipelotrichaceae bacterium]|nr:hypothetical protein [Erysipelotrichaceae bacterium]